MAQLKISEALASKPAAALDGTEGFFALQAGETKGATVDQVKTFVGAPESLDDLSDVDLTTAAPTDQQVLVFDFASGLWVPADQSGGAETFLELTDSPVNYTGSGNFAVRVNGAETALEFIDLNTIYAQLGSANVFTDVQTIESAAPEIVFSETDTTDQNWRLAAGGGVYSIQDINDSFVFIRNNISLTHGGGMQVGAPTGGDQGAGTVNAEGLFENGESALIENTSGVVIQQAFASTGAVVSTTSAIPYDDTIPQITEGAEALSASFTPKRSDSRVRIIATLQLRASNKGKVDTVALFRGGISDALGVAACHTQEDDQASPASAAIFSVSAVADIASPGTSAQTFSARFGQDGSDTLYLNANATGGRIYGGAYASTLEIVEYMP